MSEMENMQERTLFTHDDLIVYVNPHIIYSDDNILLVSIYQGEYTLTAIERMKPLSFRFNNCVFSLLNLWSNVYSINIEEIIRICQDSTPFPDIKKINKNITLEHIARFDEPYNIILLLGKQFYEIKKVSDG